MTTLRFFLVSLTVLSSPVVAVPAAATENKSVLFDSLGPQKIDAVEYKDTKSKRENLLKTSGHHDVIDFAPFFAPSSSLRNGNERRLLDSCDSQEHSDRCSAVLAASIFNLNDDAGIYSGCGALANEKSDAFCMDPDLGKLCCGDSDTCCEINAGAVAGVIIAGIVLLVASIFGCCWCCKCCVCYDKLHGKNDDNVPVAQAKPAEPPSPTKTADMDA